ncbi:MAG: alpha/beta hydrolase [Alphaproteobacteria bacterium]|nr:alpha/beta hydrolase [Alphaproteobacteria bacterium]
MAAFRECRFLSQDGRSLYYRDYGDPLAAAAPVLCLPGLTRNSKDFHSLAGRLAASRRVICPDYRGRGQSEYDRDPRNYHPAVHLNDTRHLMTVTGLDDVVVVGTSFGGLLAIGLAIISPSSLRAVVLNDVGPEVSNKGLRRIMDYIGKDNPQTDWDAAAAEVARMFPTLSGQSRAALLNEAQATWREGDDGMLHFDWDTRLAEVVAGARGETDPWVLFRALRRFPVLALRGELSDVLSVETFDRMARMHPDLATVTVPKRGHPLTLNEPEVTEAIDAFLARI